MWFDLNYADAGSCGVVDVCCTSRWCVSSAVLLSFGFSLVRVHAEGKWAEREG